ncbi:hypothetical protein XENTR_v10006424 [Xenopus tropicalis]|nr:hypothetical protein XENTR_v10006424 [Xenopus tropicalis]
MAHRQGREGRVWQVFAVLQPLIWVWSCDNMGVVSSGCGFKKGSGQNWLPLSALHHVGRKNSGPRYNRSWTALMYSIFFSKTFRAMANKANLEKLCVF